MNEIISKILSGKFKAETRFKQPGFTYSPCSPFTKNKERIQNFEETGYSKHIYQNKLDKACQLDGFCRF